MTLPRSSVASWALSALLLAALGAVGEALEPSEGPLGSRLPLLPALRDAAALLLGAEAGGEHGVASVLKVKCWFTPCCLRSHLPFQAPSCATSFSPLVAGP